MMSETARITIRDLSAYGISTETLTVVGCLLESDEAYLELGARILKLVDSGETLTEPKLLEIAVELLKEQIT